MRQDTPVEVLEPNSKPHMIKYTIGNLFQSGFFALFFGIFAASFLQSVTSGIIVGVGIAVIQFVGGILWSKKSLDSKEYEVFDDKIRETKGVLATERRSISFDDVTDIQYGQSMIESQFDVGHVDLSTAGSDGSQMSLKYLDNAEELYQEIETKIN